MVMSAPSTSKVNLFAGYSSKCGNCPKIIVSKENQSVHSAHNVKRKQVRQFHLDGEIVPKGNQSVCDYILLDDTEKKAYLIELKGRNTEGAIPQIERSEQLVKASLPGYALFYRIVFSGSGTHSVAKSNLLAWKAKHGMRGNVYVASFGRSVYEEKI